MCAAVAGSSAVSLPALLICNDFGGMRFFNVFIFTFFSPFSNMIDVELIP